MSLFIKILAEKNKKKSEFKAKAKRLKMILISKQIKMSKINAIRRKKKGVK